jgi:hypothetical protein
MSEYENVLAEAIKKLQHAIDLHNGSGVPNMRTQDAMLALKHLSELIIFRWEQK